MKKFWTKTEKFFSLLLAATTAFTACTDDNEDFRQATGKALDIQVAVKPTSRAMVMGTALPEGAQIGVNVTATDGSEYDGQNTGYLNVAYTATGTGTSQTWGSTAPVMLSGTEGKMYAYFPYTQGIDYTAVAVNIADQHDWMYGTEAYAVSDKAPSADVVLAHAQTALNINVVRDDAYTGTGVVETLSVTSEGLASEGTLDTCDGSWSSVNGANTAISIISAPFTLDGTTLTNQENPYMFVPASDETKGFTVTATVDGKAYNVGVAMNEAFAQGKMYQLNVKVTNTGLVVSKVTLVDWNIDTTLPEGTLQPEQNNVPSTIKVYAVRSDNALVNIEDINTETETYLGVALHATGNNFDQKFMIAKTDAKEGSNSTFYWDYTKDDLTLSNYSTVDGVNSDIWFDDEEFVANGGKDFSLWKAGALSDFEGKNNTAIITKMTAERDMGRVLKEFNADNSQNQGFNDWYIPSLGQMALMYICNIEINAILEKIEGSSFITHVYWSSTEGNTDNGWSMHMSLGDVMSIPKEADFYVRFIRDLESNSQQEPVTPASWDAAPNGVYAVSATGLPVLPKDADPTCKAVAIIDNNAPVPQRFMIEKNDYHNAAFPAGSEGWIWWSVNMTDIPSLNNCQVYENYKYISSNYANWAKVDALMDFSGKEATEIIANYSTDEKDMCIILSKLNADETQNQGYNDWYIPACGQLAVIAVYLEEVDAVLAAIGGEEIPKMGTLSTTEYNDHAVYGINFSYYKPFYGLYDKDAGTRVRFIRDINMN